MNSLIAKLKENTDKCTCCDDAIIMLKGWLTTQLEDEIKASSQYQEISVKLAAGKEPHLAQVLSDMSSDEFQHYLNLISVTTILNDICSCGDK